MTPATESVQSLLESNGDRPLGSPSKNISPIPGGGELEKAQERIKELEQTVRGLDLLVGIISHELRTPLTTIFGNAHMLLRRLDDMDADTGIRAISDIREEAERLKWAR